VNHTTHDRGPWVRNWQCVLDADGRVILTAEEGGPRKGDRATYFNAQRAVMCVNALDGVVGVAEVLAGVRALLARLAPDDPEAAALLARLTPAALP
jgi:hypothetical protein